MGLAIAGGQYIEIAVPARGDGVYLLKVNIALVEPDDQGV
jgi:hypothetical protein